MFIQFHSWENGSLQKKLLILGRRLFQAPKWIARVLKHTLGIAVRETSQGSL